MTQIIKIYKCPICDRISTNLKYYYKHLSDEHDNYLKSIVDRAYGQ